MRVVTWQSQSGETIDVCDECQRRLEAAREWPRDGCGREYCSVSHGLHRGQCDVHPVRPVQVAAQG